MVYFIPVEFFGVFGRWLLAAGLWVGRQLEASSMKPKTNPCFANYLYSATL